MVDNVSLTAALSTSSTLNNSTATSTTTAVSANISTLSANLIDLSRQVQLPATVTEIVTNDTLIVSTPQGSLALSLTQLAGAQQQNVMQQLSALLSTQRPFILAIQPGSPPDQAILLLPATTISQPTASQQLQTQSQPQSQLQLPSALELPVILDANIPVSLGSTLTAIVLPLTVTLPTTLNLSDGLPASEGTPTAVISQSNNVQLGASSPNLINIVEVGDTLSLRVDQIIPSGETQTPLIQNTGEFLGAVTSNTSNGQIILSAGDMLLYIKENVTAPIGTSFLLTVEPIKAVDITVLPTALHSLPSLPEVLSNLAQIDPKIMASVLDTRIPQFNTTMGSALLFLMSSLKQGNVRNWLGSDAVDALSYGGKDGLMTKLTQELGATGQNVNDPTVGEWKSYPLPVYTNAHFQILDFYVHNNPQRPFTKPSESQPGSGYLRFLIDMQMSRLGSIQLDGLVQPKRLDIIMRSEQALPEGLHHELRDIYINTLGGMDYAGSLAFQVGRQHWLNMQKNAPKATVLT